MYLNHNFIIIVTIIIIFILWQLTGIYTSILSSGASVTWWVRFPKKITIGRMVIHSLEDQAQHHSDAVIKTFQDNVGETTRCLLCENRKLVGFTLTLLVRTITSFKF